MIDKIVRSARDLYKIDANKYIPISSKSAKIECCNGKCYFVKKTNVNTDEKYRLLYNQGVHNVLYPKIINGRYVNVKDNQTFILSDYYDSDVISNEYKTVNIIKELQVLHEQTKVKRVLSPNNSRKKMEEIFDYLTYKFNALEAFVRSVECGDYDENSILILKNYQYIIDSKKIMAKINKKLILYIKNNKSVYYSFVHNNPTNNHLLVSNGNSYLISLEKSKLGIPSLDIVKYYIQNESIGVDIKELITEYFSRFDDSFYIEYFYFFVMFYYIKSINIVNNDYITSQTFVYAANKLNFFIERFDLNNYK